MRWLMWTGLGVAAVGFLFAAFVFAFLGFVVHGVFFVFEAVLAAAVAGIACWWRREIRRVDAEIVAQEETRLLDVEQIAAHKPPSPRRPDRLGRWRLACGRAARRIREGAR